MVSTIETSACTTECGVRRVCRWYINKVNKSFCLCNNGWYGPKCTLQSAVHCGLNSFQFGSRCLCPLRSYGPTCHNKFDPCQTSKCAQGSTCISLDLEQKLPSSQIYVCICAIIKFGENCKFEAALLHVETPAPRIEMINTNIPIMLVYFVMVEQGSIGAFYIRNRALLASVPFSHVVSFPFEGHSYLSSFIFIQIMFDGSISGSTFYWVALLKYKIRTITGVLTSENTCPYVSQLLNTTIMTWSYLKRVKFYYRACQSTIRCFVDESYICLCDKNKRLDCLVFDHATSNCSSEGHSQN